MNDWWNWAVWLVFQTTCGAFTVGYLWGITVVKWTQVRPIGRLTDKLLAACHQRDTVVIDAITHAERQHNEDLRRISRLEQRILELERYTGEDGEAWKRGGE